MSFRVQLIVLETNNIDQSVVDGVKRLQEIVQSAEFGIKAAAAASRTNSTDPLLTVRGIVELANTTLETVSGLKTNVDWIKSKANRVAFGRLQEYATEYGFYRS
jgi:hypothetical protein